MPGDDEKEETTDYTDYADFFIFFYNYFACHEFFTNRSQWKEDEITYALDEKIRIIPFRVENVTPRGALRVLKVRSQWIDARQPPQQKDLNRLVKAVRNYLEKNKENEKETVSTDIEIPGNNGVSFRLCQDNK